MRSITRFVCSAALFLALPELAAAQCSYITSTLLNYTNTNTCSSQDPYEEVWDRKRYEITTKTKCQEQNWKIRDNVTDTVDAYLWQDCGGANPQGSRPICTGYFNGPWDMGLVQGQPLKHKWRLNVEDGNWNGTGCEGEDPTFNYDRELATEECSGDFCCGAGVISECQQLQGDFNTAACSCNFGTPILIDIDGDGFQLSSFADGVQFDIASCGTLRQMSWTARGSDDAFLVFDRNGNGLIDGGKEWFGNHTEQPDRDGARNGFEALRVFDTNRDGHVGPADAQYAALQLWVDRNHNGRSEPEELLGLWEAGIESISVEYREAESRDRYGNRFKLRAKVAGKRAGPFAYDVYFTLTDSGRKTVALKPNEATRQR